MSEKSRFHSIRSTAYVLLTLSVLYVLSSGPVFAFYVSGKNDQVAYHRFLTFYVPLVWADTKTPAALRDWPVSDFLGTDYTIMDQGILSPGEGGVK